MELMEVINGALTPAVVAIAVLGIVLIMVMIAVLFQRPQPRKVELEVGELFVNQDGEAVELEPKEKILLVFGCLPEDITHSQDYPGVWFLPSDSRVETVYVPLEEDDDEKEDQEPEMVEEE